MGETRKTRSIILRLEGIFSILISNQGWISISDLSRKTSLSTTVLRSWLSCIDYIQQQQPILIDTSNSRTRIRLGERENK